ncbi:MAG: transporter substrate-binding domain-containing protein [Oscillospiraceae bacterium]|nr:transporter substrate-binding domain-containing protein [Oscillospiraceae bacterium]
MKKNISLALTALLLSGVIFAMVAMTSCGSGSGGGSEKLICGITDFEPMNYKDTSGNWIGFDTELAKLVGEKLKMTVEFQEIAWESKYQELEAGTINCIWNGFGANSNEADGTPRSEIVDFSYSYMLNQQSVVVKAERAGEFKSENDLIGKTAAAEGGSSGESFAIEAVGDSGTVVTSAAQINTFIEVKSGAVDCAIVDVLLAQRLAGTGDYYDLVVADINLESEVYAIGFKKGSALREKVNGALQELYDNGKMAELAEKYGLENSLILDKGAVG